MRIVGGRFKGLALAALGKGDPAAHLRPTSDRVRESLFNILANYGLPDGAVVLDLFAGTGALGLEALSRGATHVTFVESGPKALGLIRTNVEKAKAQGDCTVFRTDATRLGPSSQPTSLVFLDPPYGKGLGERALASAAKGGWLEAGALVVWEEASTQVAPAGFRMIDQRRYGAAHLHFLEFMNET